MMGSIDDSWPARKLSALVFSIQRFTIAGCISENTAVRMASQEVIRQCPLNLSPHYPSMHQEQHTAVPMDNQEFICTCLLHLASHCLVIGKSLSIQWRPTSCSCMLGSIDDSWPATNLSAFVFSIQGPTIARRAL